jgi:integrase/recombinase XerD
LAEEAQVEDTALQPHSGHAGRQSLEICSRLALSDAQREYNKVIGQFPL